MVERQGRNIDYTRILLAFLIASFIFILGVSAGYIVKSLMEKTSISLEQTLSNEFISLQTLSELQDDYPCDSFVLDKSSEKLDYLGNVINTLEIKNGKDDATVLELKQFYSILEAKHYVLVKQRKERCSENYTTILFFYSNQKECKYNVDQVSFMLSYLRKKHDNLRVYSFDLNLDSDIVQMFKKQYSLGNCSEVIVNEKKIVGSIENAEYIEKLFTNL